MTPEAVTAASDTVLGLGIAFVIATLSCWYVVPGLTRSAVSKLSVPRRAPSAAPPPALIVLSPTKIMSWERDRRIVIGANRLRMTRKTKTENQKLAVLKTENRKLKQQLGDITDGQAKGIDLFLEAERAKKPLTRTAASLLLGKDKTVALQLIGDREPVPPELAKMEAVPT